MAMAAMAMHSAEGGSMSSTIACPGYSDFCPVCPFGELIPPSCSDPACRHATYHCPEAGHCPCQSAELRGAGFAELVRRHRARVQRDARVDARARKARPRSIEYGLGKALDAGFARFQARRAAQGR